MKKISTGDRVRFLNSIGGGVVKGFQNKQVVIVEDEHGFDVTVLISECVVVESASDNKMGSFSDEGNFQEEILKGTKQQLEDSLPDVRISESYQPEETVEGEKITACIAYLPVDPKNLSTTRYECYFVNDSNYFLFFNYMNRENNSWKSRYNGIVEPNTKIFLEEFGKNELNEIEKIAVQYIAFKHNKTYKFKNPCSVELRIDTVKFYKLHSFRENDYFEDNAIIYYIIKNDIPERELLISAGDLEQAMKEKEISERRPAKEPIRKRKSDPVMEVDLHINELIDTTAGMNNADILEYQMNKFNDVMKENIKNKNRRIVFIHGKGDGVLKTALLKELKKNYPSCYYQDASFQEYGYGATMVIIK